METITPNIILSEDGSATLSHPLLGDTYHSTAGAVGESLHVYVENGLKEVVTRFKDVKILEMGFGSGLNFLLTIDHAVKHRLTIDYCALELYPVDFEVICCLGYEKYVSREAYAIYLEAHRAAWGERVVLTDRISIFKMNVSLVTLSIFPADFHLVYYDAFAPDTQPELWSESVFRKIYDAMFDDGVLVTYSAKGVVKQALRAVGFTVTRRKGALGKHHQLFCVKSVW